MAGRGRGRGRSTAQTVDSSPPRPGADSAKAPIHADQKTASPKESDLTGLKRALGSLNPKSQDELDAFATKAQTFATTDEKYSELIDYLYERTFEDNEFAHKAAVVMNTLSLLADGGSKFRSNLLKRAQEYYKNRDSFKLESLSRWNGLANLICEIFKVLRIGGAPLKPLATSVYQILRELLEGCSNPEDEEGMQLECFYTQFKNVGEILEVVDQEKMDSLMCIVRDVILSGSSTQQMRCMLTEILELKSSKWKLPKTVESFYCDAMADILASQ
ncbi:predicted protein [Nematostella vectensis]|uniref:MIF4G domain-containing protein n=1 Tax=Nematostella vectensis TaxID=45351 RepID=A7S4D1_NEMVE|nr:MIF4G domain-containing protein B [Nematostella vectensis]EDO41452.1 predicted protein [Nematostella vectensis]|eukprot:XP_001633515.1 predicted protein [Nematostella vectensis]